MKTLKGAGRLYSDSSKRLPEYRSLSTIKTKDAPYWYISEGMYFCDTYETVRIPLDCIAHLWSRSSLCRMGCWVETAVFDPGFEGRPGVLLVVNNPAGLYLEQGTPIAQLVFHRTEEPTRSYSGSYQGIT